MSAARPPVTLAAFGSFTVGGERVEVRDRPTQVVRLSRDLPEFPVDPNGVYSVGHAYVQYFVPVPAERRPVVLVHGGGLTGTCWEVTPDGRPGWLQFLLRAGHPCYVVDNVERGRAGWCPVPGIGEDAPPLLRTEREAWDAFRIGPPEGYPTRTPFPGSRFPHDALAELNRQQVPRWTTTTDQAVAAVAALVRRVGPCAVIAHSQGGGIAARAAAATDGLVEDLVLVEPHGLPDGADLAGSIGRALIVAGDFIELSPLYRDLRVRWRAHLEELRTAGVAAGYLDLPAVGRPGNTHLPMMDLSSDAVVALIADHLAAD